MGRSFQPPAITSATRQGCRSIGESCRLDGRTGTLPGPRDPRDRPRRCRSSELVLLSNSHRGPAPAITALHVRKCRTAPATCPSAAEYRSAPSRSFPPRSRSRTSSLIRTIKVHRRRRTCDSATARTGHPSAVIRKRDVVPPTLLSSI